MSGMPRLTPDPEPGSALIDDEEDMSRPVFLGPPDLRPPLPYSAAVEWHREVVQTAVIETDVREHGGDALTSANRYARISPTLHAAFSGEMGERRITRPQAVRIAQDLLTRHASDVCREISARLAQAPTVWMSAQTVERAIGEKADTPKAVVPEAGMILPAEGVALLERPCVEAYPIGREKPVIPLDAPSTHMSPDGTYDVVIDGLAWLRVGTDEDPAWFIMSLINVPLTIEHLSLWLKESFRNKADEQWEPGRLDREVAALVRERFAGSTRVRVDSVGHVRPGVETGDGAIHLAARLWKTIAEGRDTSITVVDRAATRPERRRAKRAGMDAEAPVHLIHLRGRKVAGMRGDGQGGSVREHVVRGHYRHQAHGPGWKLRRWQWIEAHSRGSGPPDERPRLYRG